MFFNEYPYTDFHDLNLDWILKEIKQLRVDMEALFEQAVNDANAYTDEQIALVNADIATLRHDVADLGDAFNDLKDYVNSFAYQFDILRSYIDNSIQLEHAQTVMMIQQNNDFLLGQMESYLSQVKVINYFTGEKVTIQDMFNYLAGLHLTDAIDYDTMAARAKTYTEFANMNMSYTNLAMHGNTLYV